MNFKNLILVILLFFKFFIHKIFLFFVEIRNYLFDFNIFPVFKPKVFTLVVGNIQFGGSGKSPFVKFLVEKLLSQYSISVLSRGYGRKSKGLVVANKLSHVNNIGDEALDLYNEFGEIIKIVCSNSRKIGIEFIENNFKEVNLIIMDDGYQHRWVKPHFSIVLESWNKFIKKNAYSKEPDFRKKRADLLIHTKLNENSFLNNDFNFHTFQKYSFFNSDKEEVFLENSTNQFLKVSALAVNANFNFKNEIQIFESFDFPDHHFFKRREIEEILAFNDLQILTTTKDWVKIKELVSLAEAKRFIIVKCKVDFKEKESEFLEILTSKIDNYYENLAKKP